MSVRPIGVLAVVAGMVLPVALAVVAAQGPAPARAADVPRTADGKPDLSGIWQVLNTAAWDIQDHQASQGVPGGQGVVGGNVIHQPAATRKKRELRAPRHRRSGAKCYRRPRLM
jgi:hypothetical protein